MRLFSVSALSRPPLHKIRPFWEAFHPSTPIFSLDRNTKHHHSHANLSGGPPTIRKYTNATGGPPLFLKQSFEMNARKENFPYSLERRKQVQMKIHALFVFQKQERVHVKPPVWHKKHLTACKLKQSSLNLEACHFFRSNPVQTGPGRDCS